MPVKFITIDRETPDLLPPSVQDYLPKDHLARFVVDIVDQLDLSALNESYTGKGSQPYPPSMMLSLIFYGYTTGVFSSRKLEKATYEVIPFRFICANTHPDHDSINSFRKRFLKELEDLFLQILVIAKSLGVLKMGTISLDGTKIKANASKHKALSWKYANELEEQLKQEVEELMRLAAADNSQRTDQLNIPEELDRRESRLKAIQQAKQEMEARARQRFEQEQAEYEAKVARRVQREKETGKKLGGTPPKPPTPGPRDEDQVNLTDEESRIMPRSGGGFEQAYNAQASVDIDSGLIVTAHITQQPNDKQELVPTLEQLQHQENELGKASDILADTGYYSERNVVAASEQDVTPLVSIQREKHNTPLSERMNSTESAPPSLIEGDPVEQMKVRLQTQEGKALYAKRKSTIEPAFGLIKHVQGFRQFFLRGLNSVIGEWNLVCIGYNLKKLFGMSW